MLVHQALILGEPLYSIDIPIPEISQSEAHNRIAIFGVCHCNRHIIDDVWSVDSFPVIPGPVVTLVVYTGWI